MAYCNKVVPCGFQSACEMGSSIIYGCKVDCSPAGFIAPTFISLASVLFFVYRALFH